MAGSVLTRDWEALQMADTIAQQGHITVTGEVELTDTGTTAELKEHTPPGADPKVLLLDLVIHRHGGAQSHVAWFETLTFKMKSSGDGYDEVAILSGEIVRRVKVEHPLTFAAPPAAPSASKAPAESRAKAAAAKKKAAAKKPASKPARKPVKKTAKRSAKKPATKKRPEAFGKEKACSEKKELARPLHPPHSRCPGVTLDPAACAR
jgi:hypothetical protein